MQRLISIAAADEQRSSQTLGEVTRELEVAERRLTELDRYRRDYGSRQRPGSGASALRWQDFQEFLSKLDRAVTAQKEVIANNDAKLAAHRRHWLVKRQRLRSLREVLERLQRDERRATDRLEQRSLDEMASSRSAFESD